jgi:hypothetical protein
MGYDNKMLHMNSWRRAALTYPAQAVRAAARALEAALGLRHFCGGRPDRIGGMGAVIRNPAPVAT